MNYFDHHIGDYDEATAHLTACEDGIYCRLIRKYYAKEKPLPGDVAKLQRWVRAKTEEEKKAVVDVIEEFFSLQADGCYHQKTCDEGIAAYQAGEPERVVKKANENNRTTRHRLERSRLFQVLVDAGEHAPWNIGIAELRVLAGAILARKTPPVTANTREAATNANVAGTETVTAPATPVTATQTPVTTTQAPKVEKKKKASADAEPELTADDLVAEGLTRGVAVAWLSHRKTKRARLTALAWEGFKSEVIKAKWSLDEAVKKAIARNWISFEAKWVKEEPPRGAPLDESAMRAENARATEEARLKVFGARPSQGVIDA